MSHCQTPTCSQLAQVTLSGKLAGANGLPAKNYVMTLKPSQQGYIAGCNVNLAINTTCATSTDGSVVGIQDPLTSTVNTTSGAGSLSAGTYYSVYEWYDAAGNVTLASPETIKTLSATGSLVVNPPASGIPALAVGMDVFIGTTSGGETLQGQTVGSASFVQSAALVTGAAPASSNTTLCQVTANDTIWPTGTGYNVSLVDSVGNPIPQYPMMWQLLGPGTTINLSNGLPYYHGVVTYPVPILSQPQNHGTQSITGALSMSGYNLLNVGKIGVGTSTPGYSLDVTNGLINSDQGYLANGLGGTAGQALCSDGTALDAFCSFIPSTTTIYYQTVAADGTAQTQRPILNFSNRFSLTDSSSPARTNLDANATGSEAKLVSAPTAGASGNCMNWNANGGAGDSGFPCAATSNACTAFTSTATSGCTITADGKWLEWATGTTCTDDCTQTVTFPVAFPTACYSVQTTTFNNSAESIVKSWGVDSACTTTGVSVQLMRRGDEGSFTQTPIIWAIGK